MSRSVRRLYLLLTERCNMRCPHCYIAAGDKKSNAELNLEKYLEVISKLRNRGLNYIKMTGGEPMIRKDIVMGILEYSIRNGIQVSLETNGTLLTKDDLRFFSSLTNLELSMSLDYPDQRFDEFRVCPGGFEKVINAVRELRSNGLNITLLTTVFQNNFEIMDDMASFAVEELDTAIKFNPCIELGRAKTTDFRQQLLTPEQLVTFYHKIDKISRKYPNKITVILPFIFHNNDSGLRLTCCEPREILGIMPDGGVSLCGIGLINDETIWGNVKDEDILNIVERSIPLLEKFNQLDYSGVCSQCIFIKCCANICPAYAIEAYGTYTASYPVCQILYDNGLFPEEFLISSEKMSAG